MALSSSARISPRSATVSRTRSPRPNEVSSWTSSGGRSRTEATAELPSSNGVRQTLNVRDVITHRQERHVPADLLQRPSGPDARPVATQLEALGGRRQLD